MPFKATKESLQDSQWARTFIHPTRGAIANYRVEGTQRLGLTRFRKGGQRISAMWERERKAGRVTGTFPGFSRPATHAPGLCATAQAVFHSRTWLGSHMNQEKKCLNALGTDRLVKPP